MAKVLLNNIPLGSGWGKIVVMLVNKKKNVNCRSTIGHELQP